MGADECEHQSTINTVVLEYSSRKGSTVGGSATDHPVDANHTCNIRVAGIHPTDVGTARCLVTNRVVLLEKEGVVLSWVSSNFRTVVEWTESQGSAAAPASHHFCSQQFFRFGAGRVLFQITAQ